MITEQHASAIIYNNDETGTKLILSLSSNNNCGCAVAYQSIKNDQK